MMVNLIPQDIPSDIELVRSKINSGETLRTEDISTLQQSVGESYDRHVSATRSLSLLVQKSEKSISEKYPEIVENLLSDRKKISIAFDCIHSCVSLRMSGLLIEQILSGVKTSEEKTSQVISEFAEKTPGSDNTVPGGDATAVQLAMELRDFADAVAGREQFAVESIADAHESVFIKQEKIDPIDALVDLRTAHDMGDITMGVSETGRITSMDDKADRKNIKKEFQKHWDPLVAAQLILAVERDPAQLLRAAAVLADRY